MPQVAIEKLNGKQAKNSHVIEEWKHLMERVRQRAHELFQSRDHQKTSHLDDWLRAERELVWIPESDLVEKDGKFELRVAVPGFDAGDVTVSALPDALLVRAESTHKHSETDGDVHFCEFGERHIFRRFDLPAPIDVDKVTAALEKGILKLTAAKAKAGKQIPISA